jgi:hypothetical protein
MNQMQRCIADNIDAIHQDIMSESGGEIRLEPRDIPCI